MAKESNPNSREVDQHEQILSIQPFRIQSAEFVTVTVIPDAPFIRVQLIDGLDEVIDAVAEEPVYIIASQQCFSEKVRVEGELTKRNIIKHVRQAYRKIYQEARTLGVRRQLDSLRTLVAYSVKVTNDKSGTILIPEVVSDTLE